MVTHGAACRVWLLMLLRGKKTVMICLSPSTVQSKCTSQIDLLLAGEPAPDVTEPSILMLSSHNYVVKLVVTFLVIKLVALKLYL